MYLCVRAHGVCILEYEQQGGKQSGHRRSSRDRMRRAPLCTFQQQTQVYTTSKRRVGGLIHVRQVAKDDDIAWVIEEETTKIER